MSVAFEILSVISYDYGLIMVSHSESDECQSVLFVPGFTGFFKILLLLGLLVKNFVAQQTTASELIIHALLEDCGNILKLIWFLCFGQNGS